MQIVWVSSDDPSSTTITWHGQRGEIVEDRLDGARLVEGRNDDGRGRERLARAPAPITLWLIRHDPLPTSPTLARQ